MHAQYLLKMFFKIGSFKTPPVTACFCTSNFANIKMECIENQYTLGVFDSFRWIVIYKCFGWFDSWGASKISIHMQKKVWRTLITSCYKKLIDYLTKSLTLYHVWLFQPCPLVFTFLLKREDCDGGKIVIV